MGGARMTPEELREQVRNIYEGQKTADQKAIDLLFSIAMGQAEIMERLDKEEKDARDHS